MLGVKEYPYGVSSEFERYSGGGIAKVVLELVTEICNVDRDFEIHLIVRRMPNQKKFERISNIYVYRVGWINSKYWRMPIFALLSFLKTLQIIKRIDIIHAHDAYAIFIALFIKFFKKKIKIVSNPHGGPFTKQSKYSKLSTALYRNLEKFNLKHAEYIVFLSESEKKQLCEEYNYFPVRSIVLPMGITQLNIEKEEKGKFTLVFIGRLMPRKGLDKLILALNYLPKVVLNNIELIIVGDGSSRLELEELSVSHNLSNKVYFVGFQKKIETYLSKASILVLPSDGGEGLPISILEAMSVQVPIMISNFDPPFKEKSFYKLKNNDPDIISEGIVDLYYNPEKLFRLGEEGYKEYLENYSINSAAKRYIDLYKSLNNH